MGITEFFKKNTRHSTPLFVMATVFIGVPTLINLDSTMANLATQANVTQYDWIQAIIKASIVALTALGGFMNTTYKEWQERKSTDHKSPE